MIRIPEHLIRKLVEIEQLVLACKSGTWIEKDAASIVGGVITVTRLLSDNFDNVVTNPPYMGSKGMNGKLKIFVKNNYADVKSDTFSAFIFRNTELAHTNGNLGFMSPFVWMFILSYEKLRISLINNRMITSLVQLEYSGFDGATVPICTFTFGNNPLSSYKGSYIKLSEFRGSENQALKTLEAIQNPERSWLYSIATADFKKIPGCPIAYWCSNKVRQLFSECQLLGAISDPRQGLASADNARFLRNWFEVNLDKIGFGYSSTDKAEDSGRKWFPIDKGGEFRKWYGNQTHVINWYNNGCDLKNFKRAVVRNEKYYFRDGITWTAISSALLSVRHTNIGISSVMQE